jgi:branched-chain amino acid transport system substrate-binding protein
VTIGCLYPMAGRAARFGHDSMIAAELAAEEVNDAGGVLGRELRLLFADERSDPTSAVQAAVRYVREDLVDFLMGVYSSAVGLAVSSVARELETVFVGTEHASSRLSLEDFHPYYFRVSTNTRQSMAAGAIYAAGQPWQSYVWIAADYEYGHRQAAEFRACLTRLRPDVRFVEELWPKLFAPGYQAQLEAIARARPDVVVHGFSGGDAVAFTAQAAAAGLFDLVPVVGFDAGGDYQVLEALGDRMPDGLILGARHHLNFPDTELNRRFVRRFHQRAQRYPSHAACGAYVGVHFVAAALARAGMVGDAGAFIEAAEDMKLATPGDPEGTTARIRAIDHQIVRDYAIGVTGPNRAFPPATRMLGRWTVIEGDRLLPDEDEVQRRRQAAR